MIKVMCVKVFVDSAEVGKCWEFNTIHDAENALGWFFVHNNCDIIDVATNMIIGR